MTANARCVLAQRTLASTTGSRRIGLVVLASSRDGWRVGRTESLAVICLYRLLQAEGGTISTMMKS